MIPASPVWVVCKREVGNDDCPLQGRFPGSSRSPAIFHPQAIMQPGEKHVIVIHLSKCLFIKCQTGKYEHKLYMDPITLNLTNKERAKTISTGTKITFLFSAYIKYTPQYGTNNCSSFVLD